MQRIKQEDASGPSSPASSSSAYTDYVLYAGPPSSQTGWRYNIMKFAPTRDEKIDPSSHDAFIQPVKLNRKDPRTVRRLTEEDRERIRKRAMLKNGMQVDGQGDGEDDKDGVNSQGQASKRKEREEMDLNLVGKGVSGNIPGQQSRGKGGMFKKKIRRVFVSSEEARRLKREEWMPWVFEDDEGNERWIGRLEGGAGESASAKADARNSASFSSKADAKGTGNTGWRPTASSNETGGGGSSYVAFINDPSKDGFQVVPVHRWYKFSQDPKYVTLGTEEAEQEYERQQKAHETERWAMHKRTGIATPSAGNAKPSKSAQPAPDVRSRLLNRTESVQRQAKASERANQPKMTTVVKSGAAGAKTGKGGRDQEQEDDEFDYEEDFQDDEEGVAKIDDLADEEDTKELEERIKKEMRAANRYEGQPEVDEDEHEDDQELTGTGKEVKRLVRKSDRTGAYDSDEDDDEDLSDSGSVASAASQDRVRKDGASASHSRSSSQRPHGVHRHSSSSQRPSSHSRHHSTANSRSGSPSGSALVAKRATSPSAGRRSLPGSRASSPGAPNATKRRRDGADDVDAAKRRKNGVSPPPGDSTGLIAEADLVALFKAAPNHTLATKDVLTHFKRQLKDERNKSAIQNLLKSVATLTNDYPPQSEVGPEPRKSLPVPAWLDRLELARDRGLIPIGREGDRCPGSIADNGCDDLGELADFVEAPTGLWASTFDDGPSSGSPALYDFLSTRNLKLSHFVIGGNVLAYPEEFEALVDYGGHIGVHTKSSALSTRPSPDRSRLDSSQLTTLSDEQIVGELGWTMQIIYDKSGQVPAFWRPPYGDIDNRVRHVEMRSTVLWNFDTNDWCLTEGGGSDCSAPGEPQTDSDLEESIVDKADGPKTPGMIVLEHERTERSIEAFESTLQTVEAYGWAVRTVPDLFDLPWYQNLHSTGPAFTISSASLLSTSTREANWFAPETVTATPTRIRSPPAFETSSFERRTTRTAFNSDPEEDHVIYVTHTTAVGHTPGQLLAMLNVQIPATVWTCTLHL
ncbi:transcription factor IIF subunit tfg1 [Microbotryomycetes sp. JL201]|nr:transcription factor IIF subunit tfg1 [Microbotryomycetes sp. JL201]